MPRASTSTRHDIVVGPFNKNIQNLKRNQACHQCRKRKLKCDAKRPCSTCVRSHAYALAHASPNDRLNVPENPECTFDDVPAPSPAPAAPKSRYERLESRINELETLLRDKADTTSASPSTGSDVPSPQPSIVLSGDFGTLPDTTHSPLSHSFDGEVWSKAYFPHTARDNNTNTAGLSAFSDPLDQLAGVASLMRPTSLTDQRSNSSSMSSHDHSSGSPTVHGDIEFIPIASVTPSNVDEVTSMLYMSWPANLPDVSITRHLVQTFFTHFIHAHRMFHSASFLASLDLHPTDPRFPCTSVLHAMCAIGSLYSSPIPGSSNSNGYEYDSFANTRRFGKKRLKTFADQQVAFAKEEAEDNLAVGARAFENAQTFVILTWYFQSHARWIEACLCNGMSIRTTVPCGLNVCPPFHGISSSGVFNDKPQTILPSARNVLEDETRRNTFWVAYSIERQLGAGNSWAMLLDDRDVAQLLPLREDQFEKALLVLPLDRQWSHAKNTLITHPPDQTDSFILHVKCSILFSKVKNFNIRFKSLAYAGDPGHTPVSVDGCGPYKDPAKTTSAFIELDELVADFRNKFPSRYRNPIVEGKLDHYLNSAWNLLHITQIHLHEPYSKPGSASCISALKILNSARAIVDLLHAISSSSFDVSMLDIYCFLAWFAAGRVLVRFLKAAIDAKADDKVVCLKAEINFLCTNLAQAGARIPLAATYAKMLDDMYVSTCNEEGSAAGDEDLDSLRDLRGVSQSEEFQFQEHNASQPLTSEEMMMLVDFPINVNHAFMAE